MGGVGRDEGIVLSAAVNEESSRPQMSARHMRAFDETRSPPGRVKARVIVGSEVSE